MISVVMASYNSEKYIANQIDSILHNISSEDELIICDDCSTDGTIKIIKDYLKSNPVIKFYPADKNMGVNKNFERALSFASGDIIIISDDDDIWRNDKVEKTICHLNNKYMMVVHDCDICDENLKTVEESYFRIRNTKTGLIHNIMKPGYRGATMCFKKELLRYILPFPRNMNMFYDEWLGLMAEKHSSVFLVNDKLSSWRRLNSSVSTININVNVKTKKKKNNLFFKRVFHRLHKFVLIIYK